MLIPQLSDIWTGRCLAMQMPAVRMGLQGPQDDAHEQVCVGGDSCLDGVQLVLLVRVGALRQAGLEGEQRVELRHPGIQCVLKVL